MTLILEQNLLFPLKSIYLFEALHRESNSGKLSRACYSPNDHMAQAGPAGRQELGIPSGFLLWVAMLCYFSKCIHLGLDQ